MDDHKILIKTLTILFFVILFTCLLSFLLTLESLWNGAGGEIVLSVQGLSNLLSHFETFFALGSAGLIFLTLRVTLYRSEMAKRALDLNITQHVYQNYFAHRDFIREQVEDYLKCRPNSRLVLRNFEQLYVNYFPKNSALSFSHIGSDRDWMTDEECSRFATLIVEYAQSYQSFRNNNASPMVEAQNNIDAFITFDMPSHLGMAFKKLRFTNNQYNYLVLSPREKAFSFFQQLSEFHNFMCHIAHIEKNPFQNNERQFLRNCFVRQESALSEFFHDASPANSTLNWLHDISAAYGRDSTGLLDSCRALTAYRAGLERIPIKDAALVRALQRGQLSCNGVVPSVFI